MREEKLGKAFLFAAPSQEQDGTRSSLEICGSVVQRRDLQIGLGQSGDRSL
jgi:hypothetical protein